jgi:hypothetical protein
VNDAAELWAVKVNGKSKRDDHGDGNEQQRSGSHALENSGRRLNLS